MNHHSAKRIIAVNLEKTHDIDNDDEMFETDPEVIKEIELSRKFKTCVSDMEKNEAIMECVRGESLGFVKSIQDLPFLDSEEERVVADVYYESFIMKMVAHMQAQQTVLPDERRLDYRCTKSTVWLLNVFRTMIEDAWGMDIYERDEDGGEEQDEESAEIVAAFNDKGVTALCLEMITIGIDAEVQLEAVRLLVGMLFKEGGALDVQEKINQILTSTHSQLFFKQCK